MSAAIEPTHAAAVRTQLERVLRSRAFRNSAVLRSLLAYLADKCLAGEGETLKEYSIGLDVLGRPASFDPRQESVVRMHTGRLRQKLADYYSSEGASDTVLIELPKGGFRLTFGSVAARREEAKRPALPPWRPLSRREVYLTAALAFAVITASVAFVHPWPQAKLKSDTDSAAAWTPELRELWDPLISSGRRLVICMATPLFVDIPGFGEIRDSSINDWDNVPASKRLAAIEDALSLGMSEPSYDYTEAGTATGAFLLGQFLAPRRQNVVLARASTLSWPEIAEDNIVFLGSPGGIHQAQDLPIQDAQVVLEPKGIRNLHPRNGEPAFIADRPGTDGEESGQTYALISRLPSMNGHGAILMLSGNQIASVTGSVQAFTSPSIARTLVSKLKAGNGKIPAYFQVVLSVKSMDDVPVDVSYVLHRELPRP